MIEKAKNLLVLPAAFDWADIGSFRDIYDVSDYEMTAIYSRRRGLYARNEEFIHS